MNKQSGTSRQLDFSAIFCELAVSADGYIRLSFGELQTVSLIHLISGLDEEFSSPIYGGAMPTEIAGYTEWVSTTVPAITIGWDWEIDAGYSHFLPRKIGLPRSNIMLKDSCGADLGPEKTLILLEALIDALAWPMEVQDYIGIRYGS